MTTGAETIRYGGAAAAAAMAALLCVFAGCMPTREETYREIDMIHLEAFGRGRKGQDYEDGLPRVDGDLTLAEAIDWAVVKAYNPGLQEVIEEMARARGRVIEAYSEALPKLTARGAYTRLDKVGGFEAFTFGARNNYSASLEVTQPLYRGGLVGAGLRAARLFSFMADESVRAKVESVAYEVARTYWDYRLAKDLFAVQTAGLESAERQLGDVEAKVQQGVATEFDRLRARVEVANFRTAVIQERNRMKLARARLCRVMGLSQSSKAEPVEALEFRPLEMSYGEAVEIAAMNRPDYYGAELDLRLQKEALKVVWSDWLPSVDASFTQLWSRPDPHDASDKWGDSWTAGVTASWPLFDGLRTYGRVLQQRAQIRQSASRLTDAQQRMLLEVREALLDLEDSHELVEAQRLNQESAELALELVEIGKEAGVRTDLQVVDTRAALIRAKGLYYEALYDHTIARMDLERAIGLLAPRSAAGESGHPVPPASVPVPGRSELLPAPGAASGSRSGP